MASSTGFEAVLAAADHEPTRLAVFSDLDGTLSHIISDPDAVTPVPGAVDALTGLAASVGHVAVVSGRPVSFLERFFAPPVELSGLYGIEHRDEHGHSVDPTAVKWMPVISEVAADCASRFGPTVVEDKTYSLTIHYRTESAERGAEIERWCREVADERGLHARSAKMSVEMHPPISRNKGDAIADMLDEVDAAIYLGDDVGDRSAFERLAQVHVDGNLETFAAVLIQGPETPAALRDVTTDVISTPEEAVAMLESIRLSASSE